MVDQIFKGRGQAAYHLSPPSIYPGGAEDYTKSAKDNYPYGYDESQLDKARQVMEDAGYSQDNKYTVQWTQYTSDTWLGMAKILRDQLASAHIDMKIQQADFATLTKRGRDGNLEAYTLGWIADFPSPDNFEQLLNPPDTDTSKAGPSSYINWKPSNGDAAQKATDAWKKVQNNIGPGEQAQKARNEAYVQMEQANWEDVGLLNVFHSIEEAFWYDTIDYSPYGGMGINQQKFNHVKTTSSKSNNQLDRLLNGTITTMDPVAATDSSSSELISQWADPLTNFQNATTTVTNLMATDYSISDDDLTYTFQIDPNATFHDGGNVTASDFVYSWERLAASKNSRRASFLLDILGVKHDTMTITVKK